VAPVPAFVDRAGNRIPALTASPGTPARVDLHVHSTASDGSASPAEVVAHAARAGLRAVALTDHDSLAGLPEALAEGGRLGVRVICGCEFSVAAPWGEMHVLGYFLPLEAEPLEGFLVRCRADRERRGSDMVARLNRLGVGIGFEQVQVEARGGAVGRPHLARALLKAGLVRTVQEAFDRYIGWGRPGFVPKALPTFQQVASLVRRAGGVVSAAHLRERATRELLAGLKAEGLVAVETRHPVHDPELRARLTDLALELGRTGGSDWHGDDPNLTPAGRLGGQEVPAEWLDVLERARPGRREPAGVTRD
jgi:3',5'-nucleoside bisphosphate phosphatase